MRIMAKGDYYGSMLQQQLSGNFIFSETVYAGGSAIPEHFHENFYFCYVVKGSYSETCSNKDIVCSSGDVVVHPGLIVHENKFPQEKAHCFNLEIINRPQTGIDLNKLPLKKFSNAPINNNIKKAYGEFRFNDAFSPLIIEGLLYESIGFFARENKDAGPYWLKKAKTIARETGISGASLYDISLELNISSAHLAREFRKANGITLGEYIQQVKIEEACLLLKNKKTGMMEIALACGFADQSHLCKTFKKIMSVTPKQYRMMIR